MPYQNLTYFYTHRVHVHSMSLLMCIPIQNILTLTCISGVASIERVQESYPLVCVS